LASSWKKNGVTRDLENAGINKSVVDKAIVNFIYQIMHNRNLKASILCAKDPDIVQNVCFIIKQTNFSLFWLLNYQKS
jgi:hypothetical protein